MASDDDPVGKSTEPRAGASAPEPAHESVLPAGAQPLGDVRERLWQRVGGAPLAVLVDNTTCFNAAEAVSSDGAPDAHALLDLSVFTVAAACFDHIVLLPDMVPAQRIQQTLLRDMPEVLRPLETAGDDFTALDRLYVSAQANTRESRHEHERQWKTLLNRDVAIDADLAGRDFMADPVFMRPTVFSRDDDPGRRSQFASLQTVRAEFNDLVADAMGLPYLASSVRLAPASTLTQAHAQMLKALREVARSSAPSAGPTRGATFQAPFLLGVLLAEIDAPDEYASQLVRLRDQFSGFREWLRYHPARMSWEEQPQQLTDDFPKRLRDALAPEAARGQTMMSAVAGAAKVTGEPLMTAGAAAAQVVQNARGTGWYAKLVARLFRPEVRPLLHVSREAAQIQTLSAQIAKLWGEPLRRPDKLALMEISQYNSDPLMTPRVYN
jgi:hypothetical protein